MNTKLTSAKGLTTLLAVILIVMVSGCGGQGQTEMFQQQPDSFETAPQTSLPGLPEDPYVDPDEILAQRELSINKTLLQGTSCVARGTGAINAEGDINLILDPAQQGNAWALYEFEGVHTSDLPQTVKIHLGEDSDPGQLYIGYADYGAGAWQWIDSADLTNLHIGQYNGSRLPVSPGGSLYVIASAVGDTPVTVRRVELEGYPVKNVNTLTASDGQTYNSITLSWSYNEGCDGYLIEYKGTADAPPHDWALLTEIDDYSVTDFTHSAYSPVNCPALDSVTYEYRIKAFLGEDTSLDWTQDTGFRSIKFKASDGCYADKVLLSWNSGLDTLRYAVEYRQPHGAEPAGWTTLCSSLAADATGFEHTAATAAGFELQTWEVYEYRLIPLDSADPGSEIETLATDTGYSGVGSGSWNMPGGDCMHTHRSAATGPQSPELKWIVDNVKLSSADTSPVFGVDGSVFIGGTHGLKAINPDGTLKWENTNMPVPNGIALKEDGSLYFTEPSCCLVSLNPDGSENWIYLSEPPTRCPPVFAPDGTMYYANDHFEFIAVNPDGTEKWKNCDAGSGWGAPAVGPNGHIYHRGYHGHIYGFTTDGELEWTYESSGLNISSLAVSHDGTILFGDDDGVKALYPDGTLRWQHLTDEGINATPAIGLDGSVYIGSADGKLHALAGNGDLLWVFETAGEIHDSAAIDAAGTVYVGSTDGNVYAITSDGELKWTYEVLPYPNRFDIDCYPTSSISIDDNGRLFFVDRANRLYALGEQE